MTNTVGRRRQAIFEKGDPPADENHSPERGGGVFKLAIPGKRHENIGTTEQQDRCEISQIHDGLSFRLSDKEFVAFRPLAQARGARAW